MKELPKIFYSAKREFEKQFNFVVAKSKDENKDKELENYAVLFALIQEFENFLMKYEEQVSVGIKDRMDELNKYKIFLEDYEKTLKYDDEARWFYLSDMSNQDKIELTKMHNEEFLKKKAENKILNGDF
jgi:hypothetical protein